MRVPGDVRSGAGGRPAAALVARAAAGHGASRAFVWVAFFVAGALLWLPFPGATGAWAQFLSLPLAGLSTAIMVRRFKRSRAAALAVVPWAMEMEALGPPGVSVRVVSLALPGLMDADRLAPSVVRSRLAAAAALLFSMVDLESCAPAHGPVCRHSRGEGWAGWLATAGVENDPGPG